MPVKRAASSKSKPSKATTPKTGKGSKDAVTDLRAMTFYDYSVILSAIVSLAAVGIAGFSVLQGSAWWHVKRPHTEVWIGLKRTCFNWRGSYECNDNVYEDFERADCSVPGASVENRHNITFFTMIGAMVFAVLMVGISVFVVAKVRFQTIFVRVASVLGFAAAVLSATGIGLFFQTRASYAFCSDYCSYADGPCVSQHGTSMRLAIAAAALHLVALLLSVFKNFDHRLGMSEEELDGKADSDELDEVASAPVPGKRRAKALPPSTDNEGDSDAEPVTASRRPAARGRQPVKKNPIRAAISAGPPEEDVADAAGDEYGYASYDANYNGYAAGAEAQYGEGYGAAYWGDTDAGAWGGLDDCVWDETVGMYWSTTRQLHYDAQSGHYYDAASNYWLDPATETWYQV